MPSNFYIPTLTRQASSPSCSWRMGTGRNLWITSAFVVVCSEGLVVRKEPPLASIIGISSWSARCASTGTFVSASEVRRICPPLSPSEPSIVIIASVFCPLAMRCHLDQLGIELAEDSHQIALGGHHLVDVLIDHRYFVQTRRDQGHALLAQEGVHFLPIERFVGLRAAHYPASAMRGRVKRLG